MPTSSALPAVHDAVDVNDAIVRFVALYQPCSFTDLAELFVELPPSGPTNAAHLAALRQRLAGLVACGRLARHATNAAPMRRGARGYGPRRARFKLGCSFDAATPVPPSRCPHPPTHPPQRS